MNGMTGRGAVRLASFFTASALVLLIWAVQASWERDQALGALTATYRRALQDAANLATNISLTLEKDACAGTAAQSSRLAAELWRDAGQAKSALASLPAGPGQLEGAYKFLAQVGDYAMSLELGGARPTAKQRETLRQLRDYAGALEQTLRGLEAQAGNGTLDLSGLGELSGAPGGPDGFSGLTESFTGYPTLIYDGPFSDHLLEREPELTKDCPEISPEDAREVAASAALTEPEKLTPGDEERSRMPCYTFTSGDEVSVAVTKSGGFAAYFVNGRAVGAQQISRDRAREEAMAYLAYLGLPGLRETYAETKGNVLTINFAHAQDEVLFYPDLVKVGVALDTGEIVFFDARGYLMNHRQRELEAPAITAQQARQSVSSYLDAKSSRLALIPTPGGREALCYEFHCFDESGGELLVYVNAQDGREEQILKLLRTGDGTLAK